MLQNFADLVDLIGLIPNGNRVYYQRRSQPPLFIAMVDAYHKATGDNEFVKNYISVMDKEFQFWMENRTVSVVSPASGKTHSVAIYNAQVDGPRPGRQLPRRLQFRLMLFTCSVTIYCIKI